MNESESKIKQERLDSAMSLILWKSPDVLVEVLGRVMQPNPSIKLRIYALEISTKVGVYDDRLNMTWQSHLVRQPNLSIKLWICAQEISTKSDKIRIYDDRLNMTL